MLSPQTTSSRNAAHTAVANEARYLDSRSSTHRDAIDWLDKTRGRTNHPIKSGHGGIQAPCRQIVYDQGPRPDVGEPFGESAGHRAGDEMRRN